MTATQRTGEPPPHYPGAMSQNIETLAQSIALELHDLAHWVRTSPDEARDQAGAAQAIAVELQKMETLLLEDQQDAMARAYRGATPRP